MKTHWLRLCLEPKPGVVIDDAGALRCVVEKCFAGMEVEYGGYIMPDQKRVPNLGFEPLWQYMIWEPSPSERESFVDELANRVHVPGYVLHVFEKTNLGCNEVKVL